MKRYDVAKLRIDSIRSKYQDIVGERFRPLLDHPDKSLDANEIWLRIKQSFNKTAEEVLGMKKGSPQEPWITEEVLQLSEERSKLKQEKIKDPSLRPRYNFLNREIHRKTKDCKDKWLQELCSKVENAHQAAKSKEVYSTIKKIKKQHLPGCNQ